MSRKQLKQVKVGDTLLLNEIHTDILTRRKLQKLGLFANESARVVSCNTSSDYVLITSNNRICIKGDLVDKVCVTYYDYRKK